MCAGSNAIIKDQNAKIYMGYYGGNITIGDLTYIENEAGNRKGKSCTRKEMTDKIKSFTKEELAKMIIDFVDNCEE